jgi:hypothetical protein
MYIGQKIPNHISKMKNNNKRSLFQNLLLVLLVLLVITAPTYFVISQGKGAFEFTPTTLIVLSFLGLFLIASTFSIFGYDLKFEIPKIKYLTTEENAVKRYAPIYTKNERIKYFVKHALWVVPSFIFTQFWFFPFLDNYSKVAHCFDYGVLTGTHLVLYGVFVGLPLLLALLVFFTKGKKSLKIIKYGQDPLPNEKVFTKTAYIYGTKAKLRAYGVLAYILLALGLGVFGYFWANETITDILTHKSTDMCEHIVK